MKTGSVFILLLFALSICSIAQNGLSCTEYNDYILTHELTPAGPVPTALDPNGVYPYISYAETSNRPVPKKYHFIVLENDHIKITICPDLGGKVLSLIHKPSGKEVLYVPDVIRYTRILPRFYFVAGGIEVSFPISQKIVYTLLVVKENCVSVCNGQWNIRWEMTMIF